MGRRRVVPALLAVLVATLLSGHALHLRPQHLARHVPHVAADRFALPVLQRLASAERDDLPTAGAAALAPAVAWTLALAALGIVAMVGSGVVRRRSTAEPARAPPAWT